MNTTQQIMKDGLGKHWLRRASAALAGTIGAPLRMSFLEAPFEEVDEARAKRAKKGQTGHENTFHAMAASGQGIVRVDDNFLYSTRRYPGNTANNTIGGGTITAGDNSYFMTGINDAGSQMGYFSLANLTYMQTNMGPKGQIPKGQGYEMYEIGVSFNANAKVADILQLLDISSMRFNMQIGGYVLYQGPILNWPGGTGPYGFAAAATTATTTTINIQGASNGMPSPASVRRLSQPRIFAPTDNFEYVITQSANLPADNSAVALSAFTEIRINLFGSFISAIPQ